MWNGLDDAEDAFDVSAISGISLAIRTGQFQLYPKWVRLKHL